MITAIGIENFKGIRDRIEVDLKPITLLFGPNSAGKSTMLQSLHYAREIFVNRNFDPHRTVVGGEFVDLGGFRQFVHGRDLKNEIKLRLTADVGGIDSLDYSSSRYSYYFRYVPKNLRAWLEDKGEKNIDKESGILFAEPVYSVSVEISVGWSKQGRAPLITSYRVWINEQPLGAITLAVNSNDEPTFVLTDFNYEHSVLPPCFWRGERPGFPILSSPEEIVPSSEDIDDIVVVSAFSRDPAEFTKSERQQAEYREQHRRQHRREYEEFLEKECAIEGNFPYWRKLAKGFNRALFKEGIPLALFDDAMPGLKRPGRLVKPLWDAVAEENDLSEQTTQIANIIKEASEQQVHKAGFTQVQHLSRPELVNRISGSFEAFAVYANALLYFAGKTIRDELETFRYLGPLRKADSGSKDSVASSDPTRWASGTGSWDIVRTQGGGLVERVSRWLSARECLNSGYSLVLEKYDEVEHDSPLWDEIFGDMESTFAREEIKQRMNDELTRPRLFIVPTGSDVRLRPNDVGVGISQVFPVVVSALEGIFTLNAIEQPELHLHPRMQTIIGDLFIHAFKANANHFLVETHSEHLVLRIQRRIREAMLSPDDVSVIYVQEEGGITKAGVLRLDDEGDFVDDWPGGFFPERLSEL